MAASKTLHGARVVLAIGGKKIGHFSNCSVNVGIDVQPAGVLGRFSAGELVYTGYEPVSISCGAYRIWKNGPHEAAKVPKLQDLLDADDTTLTVFDRQNPDEPLLNVVAVKPAGYSINMAARSLTELSLNFIGLVASDESGDQAEDATAVEFG
jgi:hypothetical protein